MIGQKFYVNRYNVALVVEGVYIEDGIMDNTTVGGTGQDRQAGWWCESPERAAAARQRVGHHYWEDLLCEKRL